jgi:hypothetical protein
LAADLTGRLFESLPLAYSEPEVLLPGRRPQPLGLPVQVGGVAVHAAAAEGPAAVAADLDAVDLFQALLLAEALPASLAVRAPRVYSSAEGVLGR